MPNWADNVLKIFVPRHYEDLVPVIIDALAEPAGEEPRSPDATARWLDFSRLLPEPAALAVMGEGELRYQAQTVRRGRWPHSLPTPGEGADLAEAFGRLSPAHRQALEEIEAAIAEWGTEELIDWRTAKWGTKWNASEMDPPRIGVGDEEYEHDECIMIGYRFSTAWSQPAGWYQALGSALERNGMGMRAWVSHEDGGSQWNPVDDEWQTVWSEIEEMRVDVGDESAVRRMELMAGEPVFDPVPPTPLRGDTPLEMMMGAFRRME